MGNSSKQYCLFQDIEHALLSAEGIDARREHLHALMDEHSSEIVADALFDLLIVARLRLETTKAKLGDDQ